MTKAEVNINGEIRTIDLWNNEEVAKKLGKSVEAIRKMAARYDDIGVRVGRDWVYTNVHVERIRNLPGPGRPWPNKEDE